MADQKVPRRQFLKQAGISLAALSILECSSSKKTRKKPNIIFIMADDLGYSHLGCYGQKIIQTPNIDKLAKEGLLFTQAYAGCTVCAPSRATLMTGLHSGHISVRGNGGGVSLLKSDLTVAQLLKKEGYATGLFGKWGLGEAGTVGVPNKKGFDEFFGYLHQLHAQFYYPEFLWDNEKKHPIPENANMQRKVYAPDLIMDRAKAFVRRHADEPFFLYFPTTLPHHEFIAPEEDMKLYRGKFEEHPIPHWRDGYALPKEPKATFAAMVTHLDKNVGEIMKLLQDLNLDEDTIVFFTSDNGAANGPLENAEFFHANGPLRGYKRDLYEGGIRVPMIVRWPGRVKTAATTDQITYFPDIMPTLIELGDAKVNPPENIDGISIVPTLLAKGQQKQHSSIYWEAGKYDRVPPYGLQPGSLLQAVRMGKWKAVKNSPDAKTELYDLAKDLGEKHNVAHENPQIVQKMNEIMKAAHHEAPPQVDMTAEEAERLYVPRERKK